MVAGTNDGHDEVHDDLVVVGRVGPARGVRGDVFVEPRTDSPDERFAPGAVLRSAEGPMTVEWSSRTSGRQVVHFVGVDDRAGAEALRGIELFVPAAHRPALDDPDEFYDTDLLGLAVSTAAGDQLGPVVDVRHAGGASYLVIELDGRERLVPFVSAIVPEVDLAARRVIVDPPEGLFEL